MEVSLNLFDHTQYNPSVNSLTDGAIVTFAKNDVSAFCVFPKSIKVAGLKWFQDQITIIPSMVFYPDVFTILSI